MINKKMKRHFSKINNRDNLKQRLIKDIETVGCFDFPKIRPTYYVPCNLIPFNKAITEKKPENKWIHFFIDDYQFERVWNTPYKYLEILKRFEGVITTDFSMYIDMPKAQQIWNCYRNRVIACWLQKNKIKIIPAVGWSDEESYKWCFDGIPIKSNIAISTNGCLSSQMSRYYFLKGYNKMFEVLNPSKIIIVGRKLQDIENNRTIFYDSYSQDMQKRLI